MDITWCFPDGLYRTGPEAVRIVGPCHFGAGQDQVALLATITCVQQKFSMAL